MTKILFICHGNICRSPMAEFIFKKIVREHHQEADFEIASAATSTEEIWNGRGNPIYPPARAELKAQGVWCEEAESKRARQVTKADYDKYDYLICMDSSNIRNTLRIVGEDADGKVVKLLSFCGENADVSDPWYSDRFDIAYKDILRGCEAFYEKVCP